MPSNFKESAVSGQKWNRCSRIVINNNYGSVPMIQVQDDTIVSVADITPMVTASRTLTVEFNPAAVIPLRHPDTDELLGGTISQGEVYAILYSLYRQMAE